MKRKHFLKFVTDCGVQARRTLWYVACALSFICCFNGAYAQAKVRHLNVRSNVLQWNSGYDVQLMTGYGVFALGAGFSRSNHPPRFSVSKVKHRLDISEVSLRGEVALRGVFASGPLLSFGFSRSEGETTSEFKGTTSDGACTVELKSSGVVFAKHVLAGYSLFQSWGLNASVYAGAAYLEPTPSYQVSLEQTRCSVALSSADLRKPRWVPLTEFSIGLAL